MSEISHECETERNALHVFCTTSTLALERHVERHYYLKESEINFITQRRKKSIVDRVRKRCMKYIKCRRQQRHPRARIEHSQIGLHSTKLTCPNCLNCMDTIVYHQTTCITHVIAACFISVCLCMVPYSRDEYKDAIHYCSTCEIYVGSKLGVGRKLFASIKTI